MPPKTIAKLSQRKRTPGVSPPDSSAPSVAIAGIVVKKKVKSAVATSVTTRRPTLNEALIGPLRVARCPDWKEPRLEYFRQFRQRGGRWSVRVAPAQIPLPKPAPSLRPAT